MWPNLWCNNSKAIIFLAGNLFFFDISLIFPRTACLLCALCGKVTALLSFYPNYTVQNPLWKREVRPEFINATIENNLSHKSGAKSTLCNVAMKGFMLSSHIFIRTRLFLLWRDVRIQLKVIYPYLLMNMEWNMKLLVSCGTLLKNLKSNWSIANCHQNFHYDIHHWQTYVP